MNRFEKRKNIQKNIKETVAPKPDLAFKAQRRAIFFLPYNIFRFDLLLLQNMKNMMKKQAEAVIPTPFGSFKLIAFSHRAGEKMPHLAWVAQNGTADGAKTPLVRVHSECLTGDIFGSKRCDCGEQLDAALRMIGEEGGVLLYLRQEGRGIGLINKLKAYRLQDTGVDTAAANVQLGFPEDGRNYEVAREMLQQLNIPKIRLLTNNPLKVSALEKMGIEIEARIPIVIPPQVENEFYLQTKKMRMGHLI
jgi:GTP cyclohydrolase II